MSEKVTDQPVTWANIGTSRGFKDPREFERYISKLQAQIPGFNRMYEKSQEDYAAFRREAVEVMRQIVSAVSRDSHWACVNASFAATAFLAKYGESK